MLSLVVALALLALQNIEYWVPAWQPETGRPAPVSIRLPSFSVYRMHLGQPADMVRREVIIGRGEVLEPNDEARLVAAHFDARARGQLGWPLGMFCVTLAALLLLLAELRRNAGLTRLLRAQIALVGLLLVALAGAKAYLLFTGLPPYYFPLPAVVLLVAFLFDRRTAFAVNLFSSAMVASLVGFDLAVFVVFFITSYAGTLFVRKRKKRRVVIQAGSLSGWFAAMGLLVLMLVFQGTIHVPDLLNPDYSGVLASLVGGVFSGVVAWLLIGPVGWLVGKVSRGKLVDLQDLDHPILKKIREKAPGTWEHSRAMANLAEAAAAAIGADALLVRVGAYVHDAGKALTPEYFIENQSALEIDNPHDELAPEVSAECIFDHVSEGVKLLRKHGVPEAVVEFAYSHHGTSLLEYFWIKNMEGGNPAELKEESFCYPGMHPTSRETAIVMVVDAIEAASRTIKPPEKHRFEGLVQRIVFSKLSQGQLDECGLSLADLKVVTTTIVDTLVNTYHARIEYPWQRRGTGPQEAITQTGPSPAASAPPPEAITQTGPHPATGTGPQEAITKTGQHLIVGDGPHAVGPRTAANGVGSPPGPDGPGPLEHPLTASEPSPGGSSEPPAVTKPAAARPKTPLPSTPAPAPAQPSAVRTETGLGEMAAKAQIAAGETPLRATRRRDDTNPGLGRRDLKGPQPGSNGAPQKASAPEDSTAPASPFPPADDLADSEESGKAATPKAADQG